MCESFLSAGMGRSAEDSYRQRFFKPPLRQWLSRAGAIFIVLLLNVYMGCQKRIDAHAVQTSIPVPKGGGRGMVPEAITPSEARELVTTEPIVIERTAEFPRSLEAAEKNFNSGNYEAAIRLYEDLLKNNAAPAIREEALFQLGISLALADGSGRYARRSAENLKRLILEFPNCRYRRVAELLLSLQDQVNRLKAETKEKDARIKIINEELQKLKKIDLDRRRSR